MLETATPESCGMDSKIIADGLELFSAQQQGIHGVLVARNGHIVISGRRMSASVDAKYSVRKKGIVTCPKLSRPPLCWRSTT